MRNASTSPDDPAFAPEFLQPTEFLDSESPEVAGFVERVVEGAESDVERAVRIFYAVRDEIRYDPYSISMERDYFKASTTVREGFAFCIPKAILLAAAARQAGIPAKVGYADVKNHLSTEKLRASMKGKELFIYHGYTVLYLDGKWVKATPSFNRELCEKFGVRSLEFDGRSDSLLHPYDMNNRRHMEYVRERGDFADFDFEGITGAFKSYYGNPFDEDSEPQGRFEDDTPITP